MTKSESAGASDPVDVTLRAVEPDDEEFLLSVYASTREEELAQVEWPEGAKDAFLKQQYDAQRREYDARFPEAEYDVILFDGRPAGRLWVGRSDDEIRILDIAILPEFQNRGIGKVLLRRLMDEGRRTGKRLRHMVFILNEDAKRFYERLGFRTVEVFNGAYIHMEWLPDDGEGRAT